MILFTKPILKQLYANHAATVAAKGATVDHKPVVKIFNPWGAGTWLFTELDNEGLLFGLAELHDIELGYASRNELEAMRFKGLGLERDLYFVADKTLSQYTTEAKAAGRIKA